MAEADDNSANFWILELETALLEGMDGGFVKGIPQGKVVPDNLRSEFWQVCLDVKDKKDVLATFDEVFDLSEQAILRDDCRQLVDKLGNEEEDKVSITSDLESVLTFYCKSQQITYKHSNGWLDVLSPLIALKLTRAQQYNCFLAIISKFIPRGCWEKGQPFNLFRLLILYHDPELCSFLDTKKITCDTFAIGWFRTLFASACDLAVIQRIWDIYFQQNDPFFVLFLALVILINAKEQLLAFAVEDRQNIIDMLAMAPSALETDDVEDFCSLARFYASRTPYSFRRDFYSLLFDSSTPDLVSELFVSQALCLPVSVHELLHNNLVDIDRGNGVRFFVVDCRPAEQYNCGHLPTAFHLDACLMLQDPSAFATAVEALFTAQQQALAAESEAAGEHLCFMGSGREEEDQYVHMVVASFLQKHMQFVSLARGGYVALHELLQENLVFGVRDHSVQGCIVCNSESGSQTSDTVDNEEFSQRNSVLGRLTSVVKLRTAEFTEKFSIYIQNSQANQAEERHVSSSDKLGKRYRNMASVFTIDDDHDEDGRKGAVEEEIQDVVSISTWLKKPEIAGHFKCRQVNENGYMFSSCLVVTTTHLYVLREISEKPGFAYVVSRRALTAIVKITSKRRHPELITFKYGSPIGESFRITDLDRFYIPKAGDATKLVKQQIVKLLETQAKESENA